MSFRPLVSALEDRLVCSALLHVNNTQRFPFSAIGHVDVTYDSNQNGIADPGDAQAEASAVMIGPDTALTSAHVVYDATLGGLAIQVSLTPGQNSGFRPFGTFEASSWVVPTLYTLAGASDGVNTASDIAVLNFTPIHTASGAEHIGDLTGFMTPRAFSDRTLHGLGVVNVGYPADTFSGLVPFRSAGPILASREVGGIGYFEYSNLAIPIQEGSSGSPLFRKIPGTGYVVVGLTEATLEGAELNLATKITSRVNSFIKLAETIPNGGGHVLNFRFARPLHTAAVDAVFAAHHRLARAV